MESINTQLQPYFEWLMRTTLQASMMVCLILLLQRILRSKLGIRWHYSLWLLLLVRMSLPWAPQSPMSMFNMIPQSQSQRKIDYTTNEVSEGAIKLNVADKEISKSESLSTNAAPQEIPREITITPEMREEPEARLKSHVFEAISLLPLVWLIGALVLAVYICSSNFNLWRIVKCRRPLTDQKNLDLLEDCKTQMGVQTILGIVSTDKVKSPALFGFVRPRLLLPQGMVDTLSQEELRYVLLHELAHLKRHDIYVGWLMSILQVLHWFNPLVWLAFWRMRADRELACDALVLARAHNDEPKSYGRIIVSLLERFSRSQRLPAMAGILESKAQLKRRITMIAQFKKNSYQWSPLSVILIIILGCVSLPDAISIKASQTSAMESAPPISLRRIWADADGNLQGAPSPDGRYISYVDRNTGGDLAIYEIATGKKRNLTNKDTREESGEFAEFSRWSPDGKQIVYDWYNKDEFIELRIVGLDGSKPRILYRNEEVDWAQTYDWSPDGKQVLACFSRKDGPEQIVMVSVSDGSEHVLKTFDSKWPDNMCFSPDGQYIVYDLQQKEDSPEHDIYLLSVDGSREISLVEHPAHDFVLGWAPDGKHILFASDRTVSPSVWLIAVADGKPQGAPELVKPDIMRQLKPLGFTRDGSFYYGGYGGGLIATRGKKSDVYIAKLDQETGKILIPPKKMIQRFEGFNREPSYSPDGKCLAYISTRGVLGAKYRPPVLCIRSLEDGQERVLLPKLKNFALKCWSPDCRYVRVKGMDDKDRRGIFQVDAQTGDITPIVLGDEHKDVGGYCQWSRDGKALFYTRDNETNDLCQIIIRNLETDIEKVLYHAPKKETLRLGISLSPDGNWLAFINFNVFGFYNTTRQGKRVIKIMPATGGEPRELYTFVHNWNNRPIPITWTVDGKYILFLREKPDKDDPKWELCRISAEGGEPHELGLEVKRSEFYSPSFHPDGQHITFQSTTRAPTEVWVMENFLPQAPVAKPALQPNFKKIRIPSQPGSGVLSPDGRKLAFVYEGSVWVVPVHGKVSPDIAGEPVRLTEPIGAWDVTGFITWSADGKWIAFNVSGEKEYDAIYVISSSGGTPGKVPVQPRRRSALSYRLSLSPDGRIVAFCSGYIRESEVEPPTSLRGSFLYTVPVGGGKVKRLTDTWSGEQTFSPDGKKIAFVKYDTFKKGELYVIPSVGGNPVQVSNSDPNRIVRGPVWSPDGKMIAFISKTASERNEVCIIPVSDTDDVSASPTKIQLPLDSYDVLAGWTPDNKIGVFLHNPDPWAIHTVPASGGQAVQVTPSGWATHPQWSPEGRRIYFRWNGGSIASVPSDGGKLSIVRIQSDPPVGLCYPGSGNTVSPDGKEIVFSNGINIYTVPVEGGESKEVTQGRYPCWSPDGKSIAFIRMYQRPVKTESGWNIYIVSSKGGDVRQLTSESDNIRRTPIDWSPDGKSIAYFTKDKTIRIVPVQGGESRIVAKAEELRNHDELAWSPDGSNLVYSSNGSIWVVSSDGGEPEEIRTGLDADAGHVSWSPDGRKLAFTAIDGGEEDLYLIENFLPASFASAEK